MATVLRRGDAWRVMWRDDNGRQRQRTFPTKALADRHAAVVAGDLARGTYIDDRAGRVTLAAYAEQYSARRVWRPSSRAQHDAHMGGLLGQRLGHRPIGAIRASDVEALVAAHAAAGYAPSTTRAVLHRLSGILAAAVRDRLIPYNPADGVRAPRPTTGTPTAAALTPGDLEQLLDVLPDRLTAYALTLALAGLRPSEAAGLTVDRVDFLRRTVRVDRQLVGATGPAPVFGPPKTPASVRTVPIPDALVDALAAHTAEHPRGEAGLLFTGRTGQPLVRQHASHAWRRAVAALAALDPPVTLPAGARGFHTLRHTFVSAHLAAGTDIATVSRMVGHKTIAETMSTYAHALSGRDVAARNNAAALLLPAPVAAVSDL